MPSSIASTVATVDVAPMEDLEGIPPIEVSVDPVEAKPSGLPGKSVRVGENGVQKEKNGSRSQPQQNVRRPHAPPGHIEPPTRENVFVPISCIFFTQRSVQSQFEDGKSLQDTFDAIAKREIRKRDLPMIDVVWKDGAYWSLSNRRLAVFSELERRGLAKQNQMASGQTPMRPLPGGLPEGWGGDAPQFSPDPAGDVSVILKSSPKEDDKRHPVPMETEKGSSPTKALPPLVKLSSSEDERVGSPAKRQQDWKRLRNSQNSAKRPAAAIAEAPKISESTPLDGHPCMCNDVVNVINKAKSAVKPLAVYFLKHPSAPRQYKADLKKPENVIAFVCGCGHEEQTLVALGKHKDRTGHACWNNSTYDSLRDLILNEDLRISCGGPIV